MAEKISSDSRAVCVHVRRGDFIGSKNHEVTGTSYFQMAVDSIRKIINEPNVYIFSDDVEWCNLNLVGISRNVTVIGNKCADSAFDSDLYLMTQFANYIIPNSSFSWWAAWLSLKPNKVVIAPKVWSRLDNFNNIDIVPDSWMRI